MEHKPVLLDKTIELLQPERGGLFIDCTAGRGGHLAEILKKLPPDGEVVGIDQDEEMIAYLRQKFSDDSRASFINGNFGDVLELLRDRVGTVNGILYDLGYNSVQLEESQRGLSFQRDEPLLMTYKAHPTEDDFTALDIVNGWSKEEIRGVIRTYGEERFAGRIAEAIVTARRKQKIMTTGELVAVIAAAVPKNYEKGRINPATRTFQALRIAVNNELEVLKKGLAAGWELLKPEGPRPPAQADSRSGVAGGRMAVIAFHSLEDKIVKDFLRAKKIEEAAEVLTKKPLIAEDREMRDNPRARSAKLRSAIKIK
jgi:16S rRNA (cytosine1402-N4)-methyltransferase